MWVLPILRHTPAPQRLSFSISAAFRPRILLVDEALSVGDYQFKQKCLERLSEARGDAGVVRDGRTRRGARSMLCVNRAMWLHEGRVECGIIQHRPKQWVGRLRDQRDCNSEADP